MNVGLPHGLGRLDVQLPDSTEVIEPRFVPGLVDEIEAIREALERGLLDGTVAVIPRGPKMIPYLVD
jgi:hypothetical protein